MITNLSFKRFVHAFTIIFIVTGMLYFYMASDFYPNLYKQQAQFYFGFAKLADVLIITCLLNPLNEMRNSWVVIGAFFAVRFLWQILAIQDYATANRPSIISLLFYIDVLCLIIIFIQQRKTKC